ncbi:MAG TPA: FlgD immunoglobulin-like domain containing protein [Verrucomicrobiae bacterium]|nr:FlgD immunoglobulin-like domain containing protein [Verrucomicrobiae bacterium]
MRKSLLAIPLFVLISLVAASAQQTAIISLSPDSFVFNAVQGGANPAPETLQIRNAGTGTMGWAFGSGIPSWLSVIPPGPSTAPTDVQLTALTGSRVPGTYLFWLKVYSNQATNSPDSVKVRFTISSPQTAVLSLSPDTFNFFAVEGGSSPPPQILQIRNTGTGTMGWSLGSGIPSWLSVIPAGPSTAPSDLQLTAMTGNLAPGTYSHTLKVFSNEATNSPDSVRVNFTVAPNQSAFISLSPDSFHFTAQQGGSPPPPQILEIRNTGSGTMGWAFGVGHPSWLSVLPIGPGTAPADVQITALPGNLIPGTYSYYLKVYSNQATNSPDSVRISLTITSAQTAVISLNPDDTINFSASQGGSSSAPQTLEIRNVGSGDMTWSFGSGIPSWLSVIPPGPALAPTDVQLTAVPGSLVPGFYSHTLQVYSNQATNSPQAVVINFLITAPPVPVLQVSENILNFEATEGQADPPSQPLAIYNGGGGDLNWNLVSDQPWLSPASASGTNAGSVNVSVSIAGLSAGPHTGHLTITASGASGSPATVTVNLNIAPVLTPASLQISQTSLDFNAQRNQSIPPQFIDISNGGQLPLNWTATILHAAPWLSINPPSGTNDGTITVSVNTDLNPLTYVDTIRIEAAGALNSPRFIPVRLNVTTDVGDEPGNRPRSFRLSQNYPNPFNPTTKIDFALPRSGHAVLEVFNVVGQKIRVLVDGELPAGAHSAVWDGRTSSGQLVGSGIYFYRLKSHDFSDIKRAVFLK